MDPIKFSFSLCWASLTSRTQRGGLLAHCIPQAPPVPTCCPATSTPSQSWCHHRREPSLASQNSGFYSCVYLQGPAAQALEGEYLAPLQGLPLQGMGWGWQMRTQMVLTKLKMSPVHRRRNRGSVGTAPCPGQTATEDCSLRISGCVVQKDLQENSPTGTAQLALRWHLES